MMFRHLEAFVETARQGSVTQAAETLYLTQPTVSGQLRELEEELGAPLFHRMPRGVELSEAGKRFLPRAKELLETRRKLLDEAAEYNGLLIGELEIHASTIPGEYLMPLCIAQFKAEHENLKISCRIHDSAETIDQVARGDAYLGVVGGTDDNPDLEFFPLWDDRLELFASAEQGRYPDKVTLKEFVRMPILCREEGSASRRTVHKYLREAGQDLCELNIILELGSTTAVKNAMEAGVGVAFISSIAAEKELRQGTLKRIEVTDLPPIERRFSLVKNKRRELSPAARVFCEFAMSKAAHCYAVASASGSSSPSAVEVLAPKSLATNIDIS